jgi:hypothetical protein
MCASCGLHPVQKRLVHIQGLVCGRDHGKWDALGVCVASGMRSEWDAQHWMILPAYHPNTTGCACSAASYQSSSWWLDRMLCDWRQLCVQCWCVR